LADLEAALKLEPNASYFITSWRRDIYIKK
jgi:hypothetical protein